jgi:hypothetical protein
MLVIASFRHSNLRYAEHAGEVQFALLTVAGLLLLPVSATYHFLLLALPVAILLSGKHWSAAQKLLVVLYGLIGFIPYRFFDRFNSSGALVLLSYPRLILMCGVFATSVAIAWTGPLNLSQERRQTIG